jgi:hypothetical protein
VTQAGLGKKQDPISKITRAKRAGGVAQAVECLTHKHEALSPNPSTHLPKKGYMYMYIHIHTVGQEVLGKRSGQAAGKVQPWEDLTSPLF